MTRYRTIVADPPWPYPEGFGRDGGVVSVTVAKRLVHGFLWKRCGCGRWYLASAKTCGNYCERAAVVKPEESKS